MSGRTGSPGTRVVQVVVVIALLAVCAAVAANLLGRTRAAESNADRAAASFTPPAVATANPPLVSVITDEVSGAEPGSKAADSAPDPWISRVSSSLSIRLAPFLVPGSGYTKTGSAAADGGSTFVQRAGEVSATSRVVVFVGGADRGSSSVALIKAATKAYAEVRSAAPDARVVVVGPIWPDAEPPSDVIALRTTLRSAASLAGATWVDPIGAGWLQAPDRWTAAGVPSAAGQRELGTRMTAVLTRALR
jgi:hypothetical protein